MSTKTKVVIAGVLFVAAGLVVLMWIWQPSRSPLAKRILSRSEGEPLCYRHIDVDVTYEIIGRFPVENDATALPGCYYFTRDSIGRLVRVEYRIGGRTAKDTIFRVARIVIEYSPEYEKRIYQDLRGMPSRANNESYSIRLKIDSRGQRISLFNYDKDGNLAPDSEGVAQYLWSVDDKGRRVKSMRLDVNGDRISDNDDVYELQWQYDEKGNTVRQSFHGKDGQLRESRDGIAIRKRKYNEKGLVIDIRDFGTDEQPKADKKDGIAILLIDHDENGYVSKLASFGVDGQPKEANPWGAATITFKHDWQTLLTVDQI